MKRPDDISDFVAFRLKRQCFAFPLEQVHQILRMVAISPVPDDSKDIIGIFELHGNVVPVLDLCERLGNRQQPIGINDRLIVVSLEKGYAAVIADEVFKLVKVSNGKIEPLPETLGNELPIISVIHREEGLLLVLDVERLLTNSVKLNP